jgi:hypothetical protein
MIVASRKSEVGRRLDRTISVLRLNVILYQPDVLPDYVNIAPWRNTWTEPVSNPGLVAASD